jgi:hypothetical protein
MIEGNTNKHLVERRLIESRNSEVIKTHSESIRFNHGSNQRQSEEIAYGLLHLEWSRGNGALVRSGGETDARRLTLVALPPKTAQSPKTALPPKTARPH